MEDIVFKIIDEFSKGSDYYEYQGSKWLIFTDEHRWIYELTSEGILWYNHNFFTECLQYVSIKSERSPDLIKSWVESRLLGKSINGSYWPMFITKGGRKKISEIVENGIKYSNPSIDLVNTYIEKISNNGIKSITSFSDGSFEQVCMDIACDDVIVKGVKEMKMIEEGSNVFMDMMSEDTILRGVKQI
jgi:hypothetical protein